MRRALLTALLLPSLMLALASFDWVMGTMYHRLGQRPRLVPAAALNANLRAVELAPWQPQFRASLGRSLLRAGHEPQEAYAQYRQALAWGPADAYLWLDYAQMLAYGGEFDDKLEHATLRLNTLAPSAYMIQGINAMTGVRYWYRGSVPQQRLWLGSMEYELRHQPKKFLKLIVATDQMYWFCASAALELPLQKWCGYLWASDDPLAPLSARGAPRR